MPSAPEKAAAATNSPSSEELNAYLESLAKDISTRYAADPSAPTRDDQASETGFALGSTPRSANRTRVETEEGVHYRHPDGITSGLYADSTPSPIRRRPLASPAAEPMTKTVGNGVYSARTKGTAAQLWYHGTAANPKAAPATTSTTAAAATAAATIAPDTSATATTSPQTTAATGTEANAGTTSATPSPQPAVYFRDFYGTRAPARAATNIAPVAGPSPASQRRGSGAHRHHDVTQMPASAGTAQPTAGASKATTAATTAAQKEAQYYFSDGKYTFEVLPSSSSSHSKERDETDRRNNNNNNNRQERHRGKAYETGHVPADSRTRSAPVKARSRSSQDGKDGAAGQRRSRSGSSGDSDPKRRAYRRSSSSSNEEAATQGRRTNAPVAATVAEAGAGGGGGEAAATASKPAPTTQPALATRAEGPRETLCTGTMTTGAAQSGATRPSPREDKTAVREPPHAQRDARREDPPHQAPTSYPRMARAVPLQPASQATATTTTKATGTSTRPRACSEPAAPAKATQPSGPTQSPAPTRPPMPVPLGPPGWLNFPRQTVVVNAAAPQPYLVPAQHAGPITGYPLNLATGPAAAGPIPNYYKQFHELQVGGATARDLMTWGRPAPVVAPGRLQPLPGPAPVPQSRPYGTTRTTTTTTTRTPANGQRRRRQPSPQSEMRFSTSEIYHPLGLFADRPGGGGYESVDTACVTYDPLERLDSGRLLLRPVSAVSSVAAPARLLPISGATPGEDVGGAYQSPWTTAPSAIRPTADHSAEPSGFSTLARYVDDGNATPDVEEEDEETAAAGRDERDRPPMLHHTTACVPAGVPSPVPGRGRPQLAPLPVYRTRATAAVAGSRSSTPPRTSPPPRTATTTAVPAVQRAPVRRALDFDARHAAVGSPAHNEPPRTRAPPQPSSPAVSPSPTKPRLTPSPAKVATANCGGGVVAEHMPPALPNSPGSGGRAGGTGGRSPGSAPSGPFAALSARALGTTPPSSTSSSRPVPYTFTATNSAPATAGQPVGALATASVGTSSTTTSGRRSVLSKEDGAQGQAALSPPPRAVQDTGLYVSPRRTVAAAAGENSPNKNYYGAFHAARLRPAPVVRSAQSASPAPAAPDANVTVSAPRTTQPLPLPAPIASAAEPLTRSPPRAQAPPAPTPAPPATDGTTRLPAPRPRLSIPNDVVLADPPARAIADSDDGHARHTGSSRFRPAAIGKRLKRKFFRRRDRTSEAAAAAPSPHGQQTSKSRAGRRVYKPMRRSSSEESETTAAAAAPAVDQGAQDEADGWETLPDEAVHTAPPPRPPPPPPRAARNLFPETHATPTAATQLTARQDVARYREPPSLHSTSLSPHLKGRKRLLPWRRS